MYLTAGMGMCTVFSIFVCEVSNLGDLDHSSQEGMKATLRSTRHFLVIGGCRFASAANCY